MESCAKDVKPKIEHCDPEVESCAKDVKPKIEHCDSEVESCAKDSGPQVMVLGTSSSTIQRRRAASHIQAVIRSFLKSRRDTRDYTATPPWLAAGPDHRPPAVHPSEATGAAGRAPPVKPPSSEDMRVAQRRDQGINMMYHYLTDPVGFEADENVDDKTFKRVKGQSASYRVIDGLVYKLDIHTARTVAEFDSGGRPRLLVPDSLRKTLMVLHHDCQGHFGVTKTLDLLQSRYYWSRMRFSVRNYVKHCHICARVKVPPHGAGQAWRVEDGSRPWDVLTVDLYTYKKVDGYDHVLVICDGFTRGVEVVACVGVPTAKQVVDCIKFRVIRGHRTTPRIIRSDHGSIFVADLVDQFAQAYRITLRKGAPEHHSTAGLAERFNSVMHDYFLTHIKGSGDERWYNYVSDLELSYNITVHSVFGESATYVEFGHEGRLPWDLAFAGLAAFDETPTAQSEKDRIIRLHSVWDHRAQQLAIHSLAVKRAGDTRRDTTVQFEIHDRVLLRRLPGHAKWIEPYHGPYRISEVLDNDNYRLRDLDSRRLVDFAHVSRLVSYPAWTNHGDVTPEPDEYFVHRIVQRRSDGKGEYEYKVRWRGYGRNADTWLSVEELMNCYEMVQDFNRRIDGDTAADGPAVVQNLGNARILPLERSASTRHFRARPDETTEDPAAGQQNGLAAVPEEDEDNPQLAGDVPDDAGPPETTGSVGDGVYAVSEILDVIRPGAPPRLNVLVQVDGVNPDTGQAWEPEWLAVSRLTTTLRRQAREMERDKYELSQVVDSQEAAPLELWQVDAADVIVRFLRRFYCLLSRPEPQNRGKLHSDGPNAALFRTDSYLFRINRDGYWVWIRPEDLSTPERRRARAFARLCSDSAHLAAALDGN